MADFDISSSSLSNAVFDSAIPERFEELDDSVGDAFEPGSVATEDLGNSFFGSNAAQKQSQAFSDFSDAAWGAVKSIASDTSQPGWVRDGALISQPFIAVGLGALGLANDAAVVIKDPSALAAPLTNPTETARQVKSSVMAFINEPNPFRQAQSMLTNLVDPAGAGIEMATKASSITRAVRNAGEAMLNDAGRVIDNVQQSGGSLLPRSFAGAANLLAPNFAGTNFYAVPPQQRFDMSKMAFAQDNSRVLVDGYRDSRGNRFGDDAQVIDGWYRESSVLPTAWAEVQSPHGYVTLPSGLHYAKLNYAAMNTDAHIRETDVLQGHGDPYSLRMEVLVDQSTGRPLNFSNRAHEFLHDSVQPETIARTDLGIDIQTFRLDGRNLADFYLSDFWNQADNPHGIPTVGKTVHLSSCNSATCVTPDQLTDISKYDYTNPKYLIPSFASRVLEVTGFLVDVIGNQSIAFSPSILGNEFGLSRPKDSLWMPHTVEVRYDKNTSSPGQLNLEEVNILSSRTLSPGENERRNTIDYLRSIVIDAERTNEELTRHSPGINP